MKATRTVDCITFFSGGEYSQIKHLNVVKSQMHKRFNLTTTTIIKPTTLLLPADTAPWIPTPMEEGTLEKFSRLQEGRKVPDYCKHCSFPFFRGTKSEVVSDESESEKNTLDNQEAFDASQYLQEQNLFNLITQVQNWKHFCPCVMRLSESNQNLKSTEKSQFCSLFSKQAFRSSQEKQNVVCQQ